MDREVNKGEKIDMTKVSHGYQTTDDADKKRFFPATTN